MGWLTKLLKKSVRYKKKKHGGGKLGFLRATIEAFARAGKATGEFGVGSLSEKLRRDLPKPVTKQQEKEMEAKRKQQQLLEDIRSGRKDLEEYLAAERAAAGRKKKAAAIGKKPVLGARMTALTDPDLYSILSPSGRPRTLISRRLA